MDIPAWLKIISVISLVAAGISAAIIVVDLITGYRQHMWIMNVVWPVTALYGGPVALWAYFQWGRMSSHKMMQKEIPGGLGQKQKPFWQMCSVATTHCGSGCAFGDLIVEWTLVLFPLTLFGQKIFAAWVWDFIVAFLLGIAFQYFTIKPMRKVSAPEGLIMAVKADTLSITCWQIGMYGWMAMVTFVIFGHELNKTNPTFWFMMQIAMWFGFATSYPMNAWLLKKGIKEKM